MDMLSRADYERHMRAMRALGDVSEDVHLNSLPPSVTATLTGTLPADATAETLVPWVRLGQVPGGSVIMTCVRADTMSPMTSMLVMVRGELP